jgi:hypothetical protein
MYQVHSAITAKLTPAIHSSLDTDTSPNLATSPPTVSSPRSHVARLRQERDDAPDHRNSEGDQQFDALHRPFE